MSNMTTEQRIKELRPLLEGIENLEEKRLTNKAMMKNLILSKVRSGNGYTHVAGSIFPLAGDLTFHPHLQINGNFAAVLTVSYFMDVPKGTLREENTLLIFESAERR